MRALRLLTLAAAMILPAAAAHAQFNVYVGPPAPYAEQPSYYGGGYWVPAHWAGYGYRRCWVPAHWVGHPGWGRERYGWHGPMWRDHDGYRDRRW